MKQEFKLVGRQGPDQGARGSWRPDRSSNGQMGWGTVGKMVAVGH